MILSDNDLNVIKWYADTDFAVHSEFKSHIGCGMTYGTKMPVTVYGKQKLNTCSTTEYKLVGADDMSTMIFGTKRFTEAQGYGIRKNIIY